MFLSQDFMLTTSAANELYHSVAEHLPIIDYHCHLDPKLIAENYQFKNMTELWLKGDHYKWRAMRAYGIPEEYITGKKEDYAKFEKWAETVPYTMCNPLYHWSHLELQRFFNIDKLLTPSTAKAIYEECTEKLSQENFRVHSLMQRCNVEVVCTTDDPADSLEYHRQIRENGFTIKVLPTWRPDKLLALENPAGYKAYIQRLETTSDHTITTYQDLLSAVQLRHDFFDQMGCRLSDHALINFYTEVCTQAELARIFDRIMSGHTLDESQQLKLKSGLLWDMAALDAEKGWVQQYHIGAIRNTFSKMHDLLGPDSGFDAIHDTSYIAEGHQFLDHLASAGKLAKTIVYNLNPRDNDALAAMVFNFNDGTTRGKMQYGASWWFLDNEEGIRKQLQTYASQGLLSGFVGMLTDSRSFLSYTRHEYFRRILCDFIGLQIEQGKLPRSEMDFLRQIVSDISYYNAKNYFQF